MKTKIGINGFGRIGRNAFKIAFERPDLEVMAVNDLTDTKTLAQLLKHDSNYGAYQHEVSYDDQNLIINGKQIKVVSEKDPAKLPWRDLGVDVVIESTGLFVDPAKAKAHIIAGAKKVIISAPAKGDGADTIVLGVNEDKVPSTGSVISNASCTTNCITPVMAILESEFGIEKAMMTTVHSYTASQVLQDGPAKDLREARSAAINIVPTTTGASIAAAKAMPALEGIFGGMSVRVPTPVVSLSDFVVVTKRDVTVEEVNQAFKKAAADPYYQGIVDATEDELVSTDYIGNSHSAIVDLKLTSVIGGNLLKVVAWYDNEWGYSNRLVELTADVANALQASGSSDADSTAVNSGTNLDKPTEDKSEDTKKTSESDSPETLHSVSEDDKPKQPEFDHTTHELLEVSSGDKSKTPEEKHDTAYIIDEGHKGEELPQSQTKEMPKLPEDATNIDGVHRF